MQPRAYVKSACGEIITRVIIEVSPEGEKIKYQIDIPVVAYLTYEREDKEGKVQATSFPMIMEGNKLVVARDAEEFPPEFSRPKDWDYSWREISEQVMKHFNERGKLPSEIDLTKQKRRID